MNFPSSKPFHGTTISPHRSNCEIKAYIKLKSEIGRAPKSNISSKISAVIEAIKEFTRSLKVATFSIEERNNFFGKGRIKENDM